MVDIYLHSLLLLFLYFQTKKKVIINEKKDLKKIEIEKCKNKQTDKIKKSKLLKANQSIRDRFDRSQSQSIDHHHESMETLFMLILGKDIFFSFERNDQREKKIKLVVNQR